jgi:uncharacterized protein (DUF433 family)
MDCPEEPGACSGNPPAIMPRGPDGEGWITGTRLYARDVIEALEQHGTITATARATGLNVHQVRVAIEYVERASAGS